MKIWKFRGFLIPVAYFQFIYFIKLCLRIYQFFTLKRFSFLLHAVIFFCSKWYINSRTQFFLAENWTFFVIWFPIWNTQIINYLKKILNVLELLSNSLAASCPSAKPSIYYSTNHKQHEQLIHRFNGIWYSVPGNSAAGAALFFR